jgi:hypothetical protein
MGAAGSGNKELVQLLLQRGADYETKNIVSDFYTTTPSV